MTDLDELIRDSLAEDAGRARLDRRRWAPSLEGLAAPRRLRFPTHSRVPRALTGLVAAAALVAALVVPLVVLSELRTDPEDARQAGAGPGRYGLSFDLPAGWDSRMFQSGDTRYVLLANFDIPGGHEVFSSELRDGLGPGQVTVFLQEITEICPCPGFEPVEGPIAVTRSDMTSFEGVPTEHAFGLRRFVTSERWFDLWIEFGSRPAPDALLTEVNDTLGTLRIGPESGWVIHDDRDDAVRVSTPATWTWREDPVPNLGEPRILFAAGTWPFSAGGQCGPNPALEELPADGAFLWLLEYRLPDRLDDFPLRPYPLTITSEPEVTECSTAHPTYLLRFRDGFRFFQFQVALGQAATEATRRDVVDVLNSMWPGALPQEETLARALELCDRTVWIRCPLADWVRNTIWDAGFLVDGRTQSAIIGTADGRSFYMWATGDQGRPLEPVYQPLMEVDGVDVLADGNLRAVWSTRGIRVWVEGGPTDVNLPTEEQLEELVRASVRTRV
jgi:hypothetical protein